MVATNFAVQTIQTLIDAARAQLVRVLAAETHQSFPVPVLDPKGMRIAFLYCPAIRVHAGFQLLAPEHLALTSAATGKLEEWREVAPDDFGQPHVRGELIGAWNMLPNGRTPDQFYAMYGRLELAYDTLLTRWAAGETGAPAHVTRMAAEFRRLFPQVTEQPLRPYYDALGSSFFAWLDKLAG